MAIRIDKVLSSHWDGPDVTVKVADERGKESRLKISPDARLALLLELLLGSAPNHPEATKVTLAPIGVGTNVSVGLDGYVLQFVLPNDKHIQLFIPPHALAGLKAKVAAMGERDAPKQH